MFIDRRSAISLLFTSTFVLQPIMAQRHERKQAALERSAQPRAAEGGVKFQIALPFDKCFPSAIDALKRSGHEIESASKDAGTIVTAMEIAGKHSQTGTRYHVAFLKDSDTLTSIRVVVTVQKRKKLLQTEPWSDPKVDQAESSRAASELREALKTP